MTQWLESGTLNPLQGGQLTWIPSSTPFLLLLWSLPLTASSSPRHTAALHSPLPPLMEVWCMAHLPKDIGILLGNFEKDFREKEKGWGGKEGRIKNFEGSLLFSTFAMKE